jgi:hypothetical protein
MNNESLNSPSPDRLVQGVLDAHDFIVALWDDADMAGGLQ